MNENTTVPVAVFEYEMSDELLLEGIRKIDSRRRSFYIAIIAAGFVFMALYLIESAVFHDNHPNLFLLLYGAFMVVYGLLGCTVFLNRAMSRQLNTMKMLSAGKERTVFTADSIRIEDERNTATVSYSVFYKAVETRRLWLLYAGDKKAARVFLIPKDGFADVDSYRLFQEYAFRHLNPKSVKRLK